MEEAMDLAAFDTRRGGEKGFELQLRNPATRAPLPWWVRVRGYDSDSYQAKLQAHQRRRLERHPSEKITVEQMEADSLEVAAALVAGWWMINAEGQKVGVRLDGQPFDFSPITAVTFLKRFPAFREQIEAAAGDRGNFLQGSASGSSPTSSTSAS